MWSAAWRTDGFGLLVGHTVADRRDAWYRLVSVADGVLFGADVPYDVSGGCAVRVGDGLRVIAVASPIDPTDFRTSHILMHAVGLDGALGAPVEIPFDFSLVGDTYACSAVAVGDGFLLQPNSEGVDDLILHVTPDGRVLDTWSELAPCLVPTADGSWLALFSSEPYGRRVLLPGPLGDPFGGEIKPADAGTLAESWSTESFCGPGYWTTPAAVNTHVLFDPCTMPDRLRYPAPPPPRPYRVLQFRDDSDRLVLEDWRVASLDAPPVSAATTLGTFVVVAKTPSGPDRPGGDAFWHVLDVARFAGAVRNPTGTLGIEDRTIMNAYSVGPMQVDGGRAAFVLETALDEGPSYLVILGCLEGP
jgi:hypothetical protein